MKNIQVKVLCAVIIAMVFGACESKLEDKYLNPEKTDKTSVGAFFTKMLDNKRVRSEYWVYRTVFLSHQTIYTQSASYVNGLKLYQQKQSYTDTHWNDFYTPSGAGLIAHFREIEKMFADMSEDEQQLWEVYRQAAKVALYDQTAQMVDLWGDIPFYEAGRLNATDTDITPPKFDDAATIYSDIIKGLESVSDYFENASLDPEVQSSFSKQDILLGGDIDLWRRYTNSLLLRLLMRVSFVDENMAKAKALEILNNQAEYPLLGEEQNVLLHPLDTYTESLQKALYEGSNHIATEYMLDGLMKPASDPRIPVFYDKGVDESGTPNDDYYSMSLAIPSSEQEKIIKTRKHAILDSATFVQNNRLPGVVMTAAEVSFLKAEAFERWGSSADAETAFKEGLERSVSFYYYLNSTSNVEKDPIELPTDGEMDAFLTSPAVAYAGTSEEKLAKIWTQKWLHFAFLQPNQSWAELRRTKHPELTFIEDVSTPEASLPPARFLYPSTERLYNAENYQKVAEKDLTTTKIFWDVK
ncbi:SusD/RagB family nutrient-binding outer membrane lipoprotein [Rapidithrix thailandica]|uniref:SusD/RagB family nutrient-binding outer membrane lipoprotein n=1 Tax=Rapidithrix thailandica TaxID=413964 RepID=A0AAW9SC66_9BACT